MNITRMLSTIFITLALGITSLSAQEPRINCPQGSFLGEDTTLFMVTTPPKELYPHIGDFYSESWENLILPQSKFTFKPPTRTIVFGDKLLSEYLLTNNSSPIKDTFYLRWELFSDIFNPTGQFDIVYYQQSVSVVPVCTGGLLSSVTWRTRACVSGDMGFGMRWFRELHDGAAKNVFVGIADGWMGGQETGVGNCYGLNSTATTNNDTKSDDDDDDSPSLDGDRSYIPVPELQSEGVKSRDIGCVVTAGVILVGFFVVL